MVDSGNSSYNLIITLDLTTGFRGTIVTKGEHLVVAGSEQDHLISGDDHAMSELHQSLVTMN